jgi:alpha-L-fucosidase
MFNTYQIAKFVVIAALIVGIVGVPQLQAGEAQLAKALTNIDQTIAKGPFQPNWESLKAHQDPEWFRDAKFGIYTHWGPVTVGAENCSNVGAQWYGRNMYVTNNPVFKFHRETFGDQNQVGYKDIIPKFTAKKFNADEWADLFAKAGAKFAGPVAIHHDNFAMWDSQLTRWNSMNMGPHRDITGELAKAIRAHGMKLLTTFHQGYAWRYYEPSFKFDGADPENADLYTEVHAPNAPPSKNFQDRWLAEVYEVLNKYQPDLIWFDLEFYAVIQPDYEQKLFATAYDWAAQNGRTIGVCQKSVAIHQYTGILDFERGREDRIVSYPWLTDTDTGPWFYQKSAKFKTVDELVDELVDIVSKNGCLLLDVGPKADGSIPDVDRRILLGMGDWLKLNSEAIYGTRPWKIFGEGPTKQAKSGGFSEKADKPFNAQDIRFTTKAGALYAITLAVPTDEISIKSLNISAGEVTAVSLLGSNEKLKWKQDAAALTIQPIKEWPCQNAVTFKIQLKP